MRTEELLDQCLQALTSGEELPPDLARYLGRHPEQRAEVEELLAIAQRANRLTSAELTATTRRNMHIRLAARLGFDPAAKNRPTDMPSDGMDANHTHEQFVSLEHGPRKKPLLSLGC